MKRIKIKVILVFLFLIFFISESYAQEDIYSAAWALKKLLQNYGKEISLYPLEKELKQALKSSDIEKAVVKIGRANGIYLNQFTLASEKDFSKIKEPFISKLQNKYYFIRLREGKVEISSNRGKDYLSEKKFLNLWQKRFIAVPIINLVLKRYFPENPQGRIIFIYSYHNEAFYLFKEIFDRLYEEAKGKNLKIIYVDELGLIPQDSVERLIRTHKISEREAFLKAKKSLRDELKLIEKGIGIYDPTKFYHKIYGYLTNFRIEIEMENLKYENWKAIVAFDELNLNQLAVTLFCHGNIDRYLEIIRQYNQGFWQYNVIIRDRFFKNQLEEIATNHPGSLIITLRGLGHFGMESSLRVENFTTEIVILGEGNFFDLLVPDQLVQILKRNEVALTPEVEKILYLRAFVVECLRNYFQKKLNYRIAEATVKANQAMTKIGEDKIRRLSRDISHMIAEGRLRTTDAIYEYVFSWIKQANLLLDKPSFSKIRKP